MKRGARLVAKNAPVNVKQEIVTLYKFGPLMVDGEWREGAWVKLPNGELQFLAAIWLEHMVEV